MNAAAVIGIVVVLARARRRRLRRHRPPPRLPPGRGRALAGDPPARPLGPRRRGRRGAAGADGPRGRAGGGRRRALGTELEKATPSVPAPYVPPDPETIGVTRRQFFNRGLVALTSAGLAGFGAAVVGFLWSAPKGGFGGKIDVGKLDDINAGIDQNNGLLLRARGPRLDDRVPGRGPAQGRGGLRRRRSLDGHEDRHQRAVPEVPAPRVPRARTASARSGSSARATAASTTGWARRRAARRRGGWTASASSSAAASVTIDTGLIFQGPSIGTNTTGQEAEGPHCVTGGE